MNNLKKFYYGNFKIAKSKVWDEFNFLATSQQEQITPTKYRLSSLSHLREQKNSLKR